VPGWNTVALVYWLTSLVTTNDPNAPPPLACGWCSRDALPVEVGHMLEQVEVLQHERAVRTDGERVLLARHRDPGVGRRRWSSGLLLGHSIPFVESEQCGGSACSSPMILVNQGAGRSCSGLAFSPRRSDTGGDELRHRLSAVDTCGCMWNCLEPLNRNRCAAGFARAIRAGVDPRQGVFDVA
jgi:hypothetical protein